MLRPVLALMALVAAVPAGAATYSAKLTVPTSGRVIARDIVWNCGPDACQGATDESRPVVLCQSLAKRAGRIDSFVVDGRSVSPSDLERCNASAKGPKSSNLASQ